MTIIRCHTLGPVGVSLNGGPAPPELLWRKHLALLIYLARSPRRTRTREHLIGLLWADKPEAAARHSLNEALRVFRRTGGDDVVTAQGDQLSLSRSVELDVDELERQAAAGDLAGASSLVIGTFLEGFAIPGESEFEDWVAAERRHWSDRGAAILVEHSRRLASLGRLDEAVEAADRALRLNPVAEHALESLMRALSLKGQRAQALERYAHHVGVLEEKFGAKPSVALLQLAERVRQAPGQPARAEQNGNDETVRRRLPLVARESELQGLLAQWEACRRSSVPHAAVVLGDIGTGKTRLIEEFAARVRLEGAVGASARAVEADERQRENGLLALLTSKTLLDSPGAAAASPAAIAALAERAPVWAERFPGARGNDGGSTGGTLPLLGAVVEVLRAIAGEQPVLLWIDDAQFLDGASLLAIEALLRDGVGLPLMVLLGAAPHPERAELSTLRARLGRDIPGITIELGPLKHEAIKALAGYVLPAFSPTALERVTRRVAADSAGLPLLVVELLHAVANGLELEGGRSAWPEPLRTLSQTLPGDLPDSISAAIRVSLRRLSPEAQTVLAACSVLSERVMPGDLIQVLPLSAEQITNALDELEWARWLVGEPRGYGFLARIIRDIVARDMLTPGQRIRLTNRAVEVGIIGPPSTARPPAPAAPRLNGS
jgi:DNA-binding SARP family transcriptional activator